MNELKEGKDYVVSHSSEECPVNQWKIYIEIKVRTKDNNYNTLYVYTFVTLTEAELNDLCSYIVNLRFPHCDKYEFRAWGTQQEKY